MKLLAGLLFASFFLVPSIPGGSPVIVVTVQTRGTAGALDDFVVLYNRTGEDVSLSGWMLQARAAIFPTYNTRWTGTAGSVIPAYGYFLLACSDYDGSVSPDAVYTLGITDAGSVLLLDSSGNPADVVNFYIDDTTRSNLLSNGFVLNGDPISNLPHDNSPDGSSNTDVGLQRKLDPVDGYYLDLRNNSDDFLSAQTVVARNSQSPRPLFVNDNDGDGLMDAEELALGTNPFCPDSDRDGLSDFAEVSAGTDPNNPDTDGDGLTDGLDPTPLEVGAPAEFLENYSRTITSDIILTDLGEFAAPNPQASKGNRISLTNRMSSATKAIAAGDVEGALVSLQGILERIDGDPTPPDWLKDGEEKDSLREQVELLIALLLS